MENKWDLKISKAGRKRDASGNELRVIYHEAKMAEMAEYDQQEQEKAIERREKRRTTLAAEAEDEEKFLPGDSSSSVVV